MKQVSARSTRGESAAPATGFAERVRTAVGRSGSLVCIGLDPDPSRFPGHLADDPDAIVRFNSVIIDATSDLVCAYKPNLAFYAAHGIAGLEALVATRRRVPDDIPVILDCKVGDVANTAAAYARGYFDRWGFDAITANPYLGEDSLAPFLAYADRGVIVLCKTSNAGSGDVQDLTVKGETGPVEPIYLTVAAHAAGWAARYPASVGLVVGATYPDQLAAVRRVCPDLPILLPGVGAQGGDLEAAVRAGLDAAGGNLLISSSRAITYAGSGRDFAERARAATLNLRDAINALRATAG